MVRSLPSAPSYVCELTGGFGPLHFLHRRTRLRPAKLPLLGTPVPLLRRQPQRSGASQLLVSSPRRRRSFSLRGSGYPDGTCVASQYCPYMFSGMIT